MRRNDRDFVMGAAWGSALTGLMVLLMVIGLSGRVCQ